MTYKHSYIICVSSTSCRALFGPSVCTALWIISFPSRPNFIFPRPPARSVWDRIGTERPRGRPYQRHCAKEAFKVVDGKQTSFNSDYIRHEECHVNGGIAQRRLCAPKSRQWILYGDIPTLSTHTSHEFTPAFTSPNHLPYATFTSPNHTPH
jgi:hypothetical protein